MRSLASCLALFAFGVAGVAILAGGGACSPPKVEGRPGAGGGAGGRGGAGGTPAAGSGGAAGAPIALPDGGPAAVVPCSGGRCQDFPAEPLFDEGAPRDAPAMFGAPAFGAAPCVVEPEDGTLFPQKWLRPRIKWTGTTGLHRITMRTELEEHTLTAYTTRGSWTLPKAIWEGLSEHVVDQEVEVTVRAASGGEARARFRIAPVPASGSMVFWAVKPEESGRELFNEQEDYASELRGFTVGEESTASVLKIRDVQQGSAGQDGARRRVRCIGCHVATPDDGYVGFVDDWPWNLAIAGVKPGLTGRPLPNLSDGGLAALNLPWGGMMAFSPAFFRPGRRLVVLASSLQNYDQRWATNNAAPGKLLWYNLDSPAPMAGMLSMGSQLGEVKREGDGRGAACPAWSHDGARIVYASTQGGNFDGGLKLGTTDLHSVPFNDGAGGRATPLAGAAEAAFEEYYPAFSPDDQLIIYTRVAAGQRMYSNKLAEVAVVPSAGGAAVRLAANDPPECTGKKSPGVNNHWGKWAPAVQASGSRRYYWLLFSSNRADIAPVPRQFPDSSGANEPVVYVSQLYMSVVVVDGQEIESYPAVYLWNQPAETLNTTPIWENLSIPRSVE
jgi:hypothetical protein